MRIGIVGSQGTGKSTLSKILAEYLNYKFIPEGAREILKEYNFASYVGEEKIKKNIEFQERIRQMKQQAYLYEDCVSDRTMIDALAYTSYWLCREEKAEELIKRYKSDVKMEKTIYDLIIVCPPNIPLENDGVRSTHDPYRHAIHYLILGILEDFEYPYWVLTERDLDERLNECLATKTMREREIELITNRITNATDC